MSISHTINQSWTNRAETVSAPVTITSDGENNRDVTTVGGTPLQVDLDFAFAKLQSMFIVSDQDCTIKTNNNTTPGNTLTLKSNKPLIWYLDCGLANPITVDVTSFFLNTTVAARVQIKTLCAN